MFNLEVPEPTRTGPKKKKYDVVIVGSGMGGGTLAFALKDTGASVLLIERGDFLPTEPQNWDPQEVFGKKRYKNAEQWFDPQGKPFDPGTYYYVGGNTKLYGSSLVRFRREDFDETDHADGKSPEWFLSYDDMAPYYSLAEKTYRVHGDESEDPTLVRNEAFPYPAIPHEPTIQRIADSMAAAGYTPSHLPLGVDRREGGACILCKTCDGFPCNVLAKSDADVNCIRPAIASGNVEILTNAYVSRVYTVDGGKRAGGVEVEHRGVTFRVDAEKVVVSGGAVNSAALLLRSADENHPDGLGNSSGQVGRNYMVHNNSIMVAIDPLRKNTSTFQKTLYFNDFYLKGNKEHSYPLGHVQLIGKLQAPMMKGQAPYMPDWALSMAANRSTDWWLFTEDLPDPENRVTLAPSGNIQINWKPNNVEAHHALVRETRRMLRKVGYAFIFSAGTGIEVNSHQAGTVRAGSDPKTSVLDENCQSRDVENLYVVDSAFFPSLPVMNPALTIAANAFRVADAIAS